MSTTFVDLQAQKNAALKVLNDIQKQLSKTQGIEGAIDIHHPELSPNWPRYTHQEFPKMLYHPVKLDPQTETARQGVRERNQLNPNLPALALPPSKPMILIVNDQAALDKALEAGWVKAPPVLVAQEAEVEMVDPLAQDVMTNEGLCSRGCGKKPHRGACSKSGQ